MAQPIVIYGDAVQEARNRLRSAQTSTMVEILRYALFQGTNENASDFATKLQQRIEALPETGNAKAKAALNVAKSRIAAFVGSGSIHDIFAVGDALLYIGEYIDLGGAPDSVNQFRADLRNKTAFSADNRAREEVPGAAKSERPDLGAFKFQLTARSVVKYMERFYGPYLGADISGTTINSLAALIYLMWTSHDDVAMRAEAKAEIRDGQELVPIATMVLQYHHSLLECGLALALTSPAMGDSSVLTTYNFYDYITLVNEHTPQNPKYPRLNEVLVNGNQTLASDLGGRGLVILRDFIDIQDSPYVDCEIGLLIEQPQQRQLFTFDNQRYEAFANGRRNHALAHDSYTKGNPSLISIATRPDFSSWLGLDPVALRELAGSDRGTLAQNGGYYDSLDKALAAAGPNPGTQLQLPQPAPPPATETAASPATPRPAAGITPAQLQDLRKAIAIVQLLEG